MIVVLFAITGGWLSAAYMPSLLDTIFDSVKEQSMDPAKATFPDEPLVDRSETDDQSQEPEATDIEEGSDATETDEGDAGEGSESSLSDSESLQPSASEMLEQATGYPASSNPGILAAMALLGAIVAGAIGNMLGAYWIKIAVRWDRMSIGDKVSLFLGVFAGIVVSLPFILVFQGLGGVIEPLLTFSLILGFSSISILALRSMEEVLPWHKKTVSRRRTGRKILDTNVIIDGRILDVARTGFMEGEIYVPKFVIEELQHIADSSDALRRQRGRRGLEVLRLLQADHELEIGTEDHRIDNTGDVDGRLVKLSKALGGDLVSNDYNLNKVASLQDVRVLNINDLALSLRPNVLPGEGLAVAINREGSQSGQGIGYLEDGTMVVVEDGMSFIGETVEVAVTQVIQTERGKMIFADNPASHGRERTDLTLDQDGS